MKHAFTVISCVFLLLIASTVFASREPLLVQGKTSLYQRVITHPGATGRERPGQGAEQRFLPFTPLYVYSRQVVDGMEWMEVSPASKAEATFWIPSLSTSRWDKALCLTFADRLGRDPVPFFRSYEALDKLITSETLDADLGAIMGEYKNNAVSDSSPLVALEPKASSVPRNQFYLMPIFDFSTEYEQFNLKMLKVGCINPGAGEQSPPAQPASSPAPKRFNAGVAFIVDTTISMRPYIDKTKEFIHNTYNALETNSLGQDLSLGVVAYRNSTRFNDQLEYVARVVSPLSPVSNRRDMEQQLQALDEATVSTHSYDEDAFAGIMAAMEQLDWSPFALKLAVMITDAGAIRNDDEFSSTGLNEDEIRDLLAQKGIRLLVIHLRTETGKRHSPARTEKQYRTLTAVQDANLKSIYLPLEVRDDRSASEEFGKLSNALVNVILKSLKKHSEGQMLERPVSAAASTPEAEIERFANILGYSAQLEFVGRERNTQAPRVVEAWTVDKDLVSLSQGRPTEALTVNVLLNKRQLDSMARQLQVVVDATKSSRDIDSSQLFQRIVSLSAQTVRDPVKLQEGGASTNIAELGVLPEFLDGLPYVSWIMGISAEGWAAMSSAEQDAKIRDMEAKIQLYREYHNDLANWVTVGSPDPADALYRVPLCSLP